MKKLFSFLAIVAIIFASNCSRIPENNDPVIGIWSNTEVLLGSETAKQVIRQEWIFNDVYLGRYHRYHGSNLEVVTDFNWKQEDGIYTIGYPGTDMPDDRVSMKNSDEGERLEDAQGNVLAHRE